MSSSYRRTCKYLYEVCIRPLSFDADQRRREFILNVLLSGLLVAASIALLFTSYNYFISHIGHHIGSVVQTLVFWGIILGLLLISRYGKAPIAALIFVGFLLLSGIQFVLLWGFGLAIAELVFALTIVVAGVLFTAPLALLATLVVSVALAIVTYLQVQHIQIPTTYWQTQSPQAADVVGYMVVFLAIGLVSWLSNRETDRSLHRARQSEAALQKERDNLEVKVIERTKELEDLQLARLLELQPYAEFGRIGASLVHEIANPLTAASLHLEQLDKREHSDLVRQVQRNLNQLERYLLAARKQLKRESRLKTFAVGAELKQVINLLNNRARRANVTLIANKITNVKLYGDVVKFNQLIANLIANAIDASEGSSKGRPEVTLRVEQEGSWLVVSVTDHGMGISALQMEHLFEPFYSTKKSVRSGLGIGLAMVKQYVEHDFGGSISVLSDKQAGTVFTVRLQSQDRQ